MTRQVYVGGRFVPKEEATVSVYDHGLLYGDGVFEGIRSYGGKVYRLGEHVDRLYQSAAAIALEIPLAKEGMTDVIKESLAVNGIADGYIRVLVTRGAGALGLDINKTSNPQVIVIADSIQLYPEEYYEKGLEIITAKTIRNHPGALDPRIKSMNYLNNILAKIEGMRAGCVEALMLNHRGEVAECTGDNLFIVRNRKVTTPPLEAGILEGVTRNAVLRLSQAAGYETVEATVLPADVYAADECFLTGTAAEVIPVVKLDGQVIGEGKPGPVCRDLHERFHREVRA